MHNNEMAQTLIAGLHPRLLEKPAVWFEKNTKKILQARHTNAFWHNHMLVLEEGMRIKFSACARLLADLGYVKVHGETPGGRGTFLTRGGEIVISPINARMPVRVEFLGNAIERIALAGHADITTDNKTPDNFLASHDLSYLRTGDYVVHIDHGIGIYRGVITKEGEQYMELRYAKDDALYVPESKAERVSPYLGFRKPSVHRLGTPLWNITKRKAKEDIIALAKQLLEHYAKREIVTRPGYQPDPAMETAFASSFPFTETPGQLQALEEIYADMAQNRPMDRLLCADVGFGKTELALRSALRAVCNKRQVAVLAPTTILAEQHAQTFRERFGAIPVVTARLSRLEQKTAQKNIIAKLAGGRIDVVIGTHRLLSGDIRFKNLGLLIIDEEQRFGVRQKEHFKMMQGKVDILSLSATPLPRTLHLALAHMRPMSAITTPPPARIPPRTYVLPFSKKTIAGAVEAELQRGGQVYILSNYIRKLPVMQKLVAAAAPRARIGILHGRMNERAMMQTMRDFREHKTNILLATTIIENGLDISNANTLIVEDATRIGLADAHQLRGRIGRSAIQSYAYFLYPASPRKPKPAAAYSGVPVRIQTGTIKEKAAERLDALVRSQHLGAGRELALRDLEIRGAGNILGREQSGRVNQIGLNLYCQMLAEAVDQLQNSSG